MSEHRARARHHGRRMRQEARASPWGLAAFLAVLWLLPLPLGANRDYLWPWFAAALFLIVGALAPTRENWQAFDRRLPALVRAALLLLLLFILQCVLAMVLALGPGAEGPAPGWPADRAASWSAGMLNLACASCVVLVIALCDSSSRLRVLAATLFSVGVVQAAIGIVQALSAQGLALFPQQERFPGLALGTFLNRNHFAGFLELTGAIGLGLLVGQLSRSQDEGWRVRMRGMIGAVLGPKLVMRLLLVVLVVGLVLSRSRMGNAAFFAAMLVVGAIGYVRIRPRPRMLSLLLLSMVVIDLIVVGGHLGLGPLVERLRGTEVAIEESSGLPSVDRERAAVSRATWALAASHPVLGTGPGSFESEFVSAKPESVRLHYQHAHNDWAELFAEFGLLGGAAWAGLVLLALVAAWRSMRGVSPTGQGLAFGGMFALLSLCLHGWVDFNLQIPANRLYFHSIVGLLLASYRLHAPPWRARGELSVATHGSSARP